MTASYDGTARIWSAVEAPKIFRHPDVVWSASFSPDGARLATASYDANSRVWDVASGKLIWPLLFHGHDRTRPPPHKVWTANFSPDGARLVTASDDGITRIWIAASKEPLATCTPARKRRESAHPDLTSAAFSPDGDRIVTAAADWKARIWEVWPGSDQCREISVLKGHGNVVSNAEFDGDGTRIVTASLDGTARLWDSLSGQEIAALKPHQGKPVAVKSAAFNRQGTLVVTASADRTAQVWDVGWATKFRGEDLARRTCAEKLIGAKKFTRDDEDAVLVPLKGIDACARDGPMSWDYYGQIPAWLLHFLRDRFSQLGRHNTGVR